ncbi:MAG: esterase-like activity of phytase family protein [Xanthomonadales bacterium]|nr:esterase-like activity of phytase family protein [Xanthomonadales bacterium]
MVNAQRAFPAPVASILSVFLVPLLLAVAGATQAAAPVNVHAYAHDNPGWIVPGLHVGGFSGLVHVPSDPPNVAYTIMDRGPNGQVTVDGESRRTFPFPDLAPTLVKLKFVGHRVEVLQAIPIRRPDGQFASVLPNLESQDETPWDANGLLRLPFDPEGLDPEGIAYDPVTDTFWLCEEYMSLAQVRRDGTLLKRLVPAGIEAQLGVPYARGVLSPWLAARPQNRGFEGVGITPDGRYLFAAVQGGLLLPDKATGNASRVRRLVKVDLATDTQVGEYLYLAEEASSFEVPIAQADMSLSDLAAIDENRVLVLERDKNAGASARVKRVYAVDLALATNVLGIADIAGASLESMDALTLAANGIRPGAKSLAVDLLQAIPGFPYEKTEGLAVVDAKTLLVCHDNDYAIAIDGTTRTDTGEVSHSYRLKFSQRLF